MTAAQRIFDALRTTPGGLWTWQLLELAGISSGYLSKAVAKARRLCQPGRTITILQIRHDRRAPEGMRRQSRYAYGIDYRSLDIPREQTQTQPQAQRSEPKLCELATIVRRRLKPGSWPGEQK